MSYKSFKGKWQVGGDKPTIILWQFEHIRYTQCELSELLPGILG